MDPVAQAEETPELNLDEPEVSNDEILGAIDKELEVLSPDTTDDPVGEAEPEPDPEPTAEGEAVDDPKPDDGEADPDGDPEPEPTVDGQREPEPEPEPPAKTDGTEKPSDEFGTLGQDTPEKTRERFETIKDKFDDLTTERDGLIAERDAVRSESDQWVEAITGTGTNPEQFGMAINWLTDLNSGTPEGLQRAYETMSNELGVIAKMIGKPAPGVYDPLSEHPDLQQRIDDGLLDELGAHEIIQARASKTLNLNQSYAVDQQGQHQAAVQTALTEVKAMGEQLKSTDPVFAQKMPFLEPIIQSIVKAAPNSPETWKGAILEAYTNLPAIPLASPVTTVTTPTPNPIRPGGAGPSSSHMDKEPGSIDEAVNVALERGW